jgi:hypothetical protein
MVGIGSPVSLAAADFRTFGGLRGSIQDVSTSGFTAACDEKHISQVKRRIGSIQEELRFQGGSMVTADYLFAMLLIGALYLVAHAVHWTGGHFLRH